MSRSGILQGAVFYFHFSPQFFVICEFRPNGWLSSAVNRGGWRLAYASSEMHKASAFFHTTDAASQGSRTLTKALSCSTYSPLWKAGQDQFFCVCYTLKSLKREYAPHTERARPNAFPWFLAMEDCGIVRIQWMLYCCLHGSPQTTDRSLAVFRNICWDGGSGIYQGQTGLKVPWIPSLSQVVTVPCQCHYCAGNKSQLKPYLLSGGPFPLVDGVGVPILCALWLMTAVSNYMPIKWPDEMAIWYIMYNINSNFIHI